MNKDSSDNFIELKPGDVIYVNEDPEVQSDEVAKEPEVDKPEPVPKPEPVKKSVAPSFDIPLAEEKKPKLANRPVQQSIDEDSQKDKVGKTILPTVEPVPTISEVIPETPPPTVEPVPTISEVIPETLPQVEISLSPVESFQKAPLAPESQLPPSQPNLQQDRLGSNSPQAFDSFQQIGEPAAPVKPEVNQPFEHHLRPSSDLVTPQLPTSPNLNIDANGQVLSMPPPLASSLPPPVLNSPPLATTDIQGNLGLISTQNVAQPVVVPQQVSVPTEDAGSEEEIADSQVEDGKQSSRGLKIFFVATLFIIVSTIIMAGFFFFPKIQAVLDSRRLQDVYEFEDVLKNLLQVENQEIEVKLTDSQIKNIVPALSGQQEILDGKVSVNTVLKIKYPTDFSNPNIGSKFRFDLDLQTSNGRENLVLDVMTVLVDEEAYFKIDALSINDRPVNLETTAFADRWSDLEALLQIQAGGSLEELAENESIFLNYIANLLNLYSHPHYVVFLPTFNITQSQKYSRIEEALLKSQAYDLDTGSCQTIRDTELKCKIRINYAELYSLYEEIYDILDEDMPSYYDILKRSDRRNSNLPDVIELTFDKHRDYPVSLSVPSSDNDISASSLTIDYKSFDESSFEVEAFSNPLDISEYHEQILKYEEEIDFGM